MALDTQPHVVAVVLDHLHMNELVAERLDYSKEGTLYKDVMSDVVERKWSL